MILRTRRRRIGDKGDRVVPPLPGITFVLRDDFTTAASAPLATPRTCEPGPGTLTLIQTDGEFSVSSEKLNFPAQSGSTWGSQAWKSGSLSQVNGRALLARVRINSFGTGATGVAWKVDDNADISSAGGTRYYTLFSSTGFQISNGAGGGVTVGAISTATDYDAAIVTENGGVSWYIKGGGWTDWSLLWHMSGSIASTLYGVFSNLNGVGTVDHFRVRDMGGSFETEYGFANVNTTPVSGSDYTATANAIHDMTITAPASPSGKAGLRFRVADANNYHFAGFDGTSFRAYKVVSGTITEYAAPINVSSVIAGSGTRTIRIVADGSDPRFFTLNGSTWTARGSITGESFQSTQTTIHPAWDSGWSASALVSLPRSTAGYTPLGET